jgi:penicillin amidase
MATIFRWLMGLIVALTCIVVIGAFLAYYFAARSLPDYSASYRFTALSGPVEIVRDVHNVPHILGQSDRDVYFGLGFAHAQDRLWQMMMSRRIAQGRLSELFGERTIQVDDFMRRMDIYNLAIEAVDDQSPATQEALQAYSGGVNAWLKTVNADALGRGAPEFFLFEQEFAPWQPADSIAILKLMGLKLSDQLRSEVLRAQVSLAVGNGKTRDILPDSPTAGFLAFPEYSSLFPTLKPTIRTASAEVSPLMPVGAPGLAGASNAFAVSAKRSATGAPLLGNDPHLGLTAPGPFMLARLELQAGGVIGGTLPGIPAVFVGRGENLAWGLTSSYLDDQDLYIEQLDPKDKTRYKTPDGFKKFREKKVLLGVKDKPTLTLTLRWTDNGPVIPGTHFDLDTITPQGHVVSLAWTALAPNDTSMTAAIELMSAQSVQTARRAASKFVAPAQNIALADKDTIAMVMLGRIPDRDPAHTSQGRIPSQGWLQQNRWRGLKPFTANVGSVDPASGIVANTNNKITDAPFPDHVSFNWGDTQRIKRLEKLLNEREVHTRESFIQAQLDTVSYTARSLLPLIAKELWFISDPAPAGTPLRQRQIALDLLANWNGEMSEHLPEPLIYDAWLQELQTYLISDDLGPLAFKFTQPDPVFIERVYRDIDGAARWCDVTQSSRTETCDDIAAVSLDAAILHLTEKYGERIESWRWGQAHQAEHKHEVLGDVRFLGWLTNIRQQTSGGDNTLMRGVARGTGPKPFTNVHAAVYRAVVDFADLDSSVFITSTGQSGHFLSRYYDDLAELWRRGEYIPMSLDIDLARGGAVGTTRLLPAQ